MKQILALMIIAAVLNSCNKTEKPVVQEESWPATCDDASDEGRFEHWDISQNRFKNLSALVFPEREDRSFISSFGVTSKTIIDTAEDVFFHFHQTAPVKLKLFLVLPERTINWQLNEMESGLYNVNLSEQIRRHDIPNGCYRLYYMFLYQHESNHVLTKGHFDMQIASEQYSIYGLTDVTMARTDTFSFPVYIRSSEDKKVSLNYSPIFPRIHFFPTPSEEVGSFHSTFMVVTNEAFRGTFRQRFSVNNEKYFEFNVTVVE